MEKKDTSSKNLSLYDIVMNEKVECEKINVEVLETAMSMVTHSGNK